MSDWQTSSTWPDGVNAAVSITFDDTRPTQLDAGLPLLDCYGVKATFYATISTLEQRLDDWQAAARNGHEIGNHTTSHPCTANFPWSARIVLEDMTLDAIERDILDASEMIRELVHVTPTTFAYPCGQSFVGRGTNVRSYVPVVARHFVAGRGWNCESLADPRRGDLAQLPAMRLDDQPWSAVLEALEAATERGHWLIFAGHDVAPSGRQAVRPDVLDALCAHCTDPKHSLWIDTVAAIGKHVQNRHAHPRG